MIDLTRNKGEAAKKIILGLSVHNHQPLGNFPWVFEEAYQKAYLPMLQALQRHPGIQISLHYSGCLIGWLKANHSDFLDILRELIKRRQVELMGGGYYEPILSSIKEDDRQGQLNKMRDFLKQDFGVEATGIWLAERVWEPELAGTLAKAGVEWTLTDDTAFKMIGMEEKDLNGYFLTEDRGEILKIFPISKYLRYSIPWHTVDDVINYLNNMATEEGNRIIVLGDDGEKFGIWPKTYAHCWENGWVDEFFSALEQNSGQISLMKLGDYCRDYPALGRVYLPCAAYDEMLEWSLPAGKSHQYKELRDNLKKGRDSELLQYMYCGFWRNFLVKYPEINRLHKKMMLVHDKVYRARERSPQDCGLDYLWRAQCNCPYWHGVFGGIYLADIRAENYANIISAENHADSILSAMQPYCNLTEVDYDKDGNKELLIETPYMNIYVSPEEGGSLIEWDLRKKSYNLLNTVARRPEAYHLDIDKALKDRGGMAEGQVASIHDGITFKDKNLQNFLVYDKSPRYSLLDHFFRPDISLEKLEHSQYEETGLMAGLPYEYRLRRENKNLLLDLACRSRICTSEEYADVSFEKTLIINGENETIEVKYRITNEGRQAVRTLFGSEWNINLLGGGHNPAAFYLVKDRMPEKYLLDSRGALENITEIDLCNNHLDIDLKLSLSQPMTIWRYPVESVSNSEGGIEKIYQCSCLMLLLPLDLKPEHQVEFSLRWNW